MAYTFSDIGSTVTFFPFKPNWSSPLVENLEWKTNVIRSFSGDEQRVATRVAPRRTLEFRSLLSWQEAAAVENFLFTNLNGPMAIPAWHQGLRLAAPIDATDQTLTLEADVPAAWVEQVALVLFSSRTQYELVAPASAAGPAVTVAVRNGSSWPAGTLVYPVVVARLQSEVSISKPTGALSDAGFIASVDPVASPAAIDDSEPAAVSWLPFNGDADDYLFVDSARTWWQPNGCPRVSTDESATGASSLFFDGRSAYAYTAASTDFNLGAVDYTVELWARIPSLPASTQYLITKDASPQRFSLSINAAGAVTAMHNSDILNSPAAAITPGQWTHIALTREGSTLRLFVGGALVDSDTVSSTANTSAGLLVGRNYIGAPSVALFSGYLDDIRVVSGTALYTAGFTPPVDPLEVVAGTVVLLTGAGYDLSVALDDATGRQWSVRGGVTISAAQSVYGGVSAYFNGSGAYLSTDAGNLDVSQSDFTVESWVRLASYTSGGRPIFSYGSGSDGVYIGVNVNGELLLTGDGGDDLAGGYIPLATWTHIAVSRAGTVARLFVDGKMVAAGPWTTWTAIGEARIGRGRGSSTGYWSGYMDDFRVVRGAALYGTGMPEEITRVSILPCEGESAGTWPDNEGFSWTETGTISASGTLVFGAGSVYLDGSGEYLSTPHQAGFSPNAAGGLSIEVWIRPDAGGAGTARAIASKEGEWVLGLNASDQLTFTVYSGATPDVALTGTTALTAGNWWRVQAIRTGATWSLRVGGTQEASGTESGTPDLTANPIYVGHDATAALGDFFGHVDLFRVFRGDGLYDEGFTPAELVTDAASAFGRYEGRDVVLTQPNWSSGLSTEITFAGATVDSGTGAVAWLRTEQFARNTRRYSWTLPTRADAEEFRQFCARARGQQGAFWVPSWANDFEVTADLPDPLQQTIQVVDNVFSTAPTLAGMERLLIRTRVGDTYFRRITDVTDLGGGVLQLTLDAPLGQTLAVGDIKGVHLLMLCRFSSDKVALSWKTDGVATVDAPLTTVKA